MDSGLSCFTTQHPVWIYQENFECKSSPEFAFGGALDIPKSRRGYRAQVRINPQSVREPPPAFDERYRAALRWYHKALAATFCIDQFVFLWIVVEVFAAHAQTASSTKLRPLTLPCNHTIPVCPTCASSTEQQPRSIAAKVRAFLEGEGMDASSANEVLAFRQLLHGANKLTRSENELMEHHVARLFAVVFSVLKRTLGLEESQPPFTHPMPVWRGILLQGTSGSDPAS